MRIAALLIVLALDGCARGGQVVSEEVRKSEVSSTVVVAPPLHTPSDEQVNRFVEAMLKASADHDPQALAELIDWESFLLRSLAGLALQDTHDMGRTVTSARHGFVTTGMAATLARDMRLGGSYDFLKARTIGRETWAVFRFIDARGGHDQSMFLISAQKDGNARAVDVFMLSNGEPVSQMLRRTIIPVLAQENGGLSEQLAGTESLEFKHRDKLRAMSAAELKGDVQTGLEIYQSLPRALQERRSYMLMRIRMAQKVDVATYQQAIEDMVRLFPDDPSSAKLALDSNLARGRWDDALETLDVVVREQTTDPFHDVLRATIFLKSGRLAEAEVEARTATERDPELSWGWKILAVILHEQGKEEEAAAVIEEFRHRFPSEGSE